MSEAQPEQQASEQGRAPVIAGIVLMIGAGLFAFGNFSTGVERGSASHGAGKPGHGGGKGAKAQSSIVEVVTAEKADVLQARKVPGEIRAEEQAILRAQASGKILNVHFTLGDQVEEKALLLSLDPKTLPAELRRAKASKSAADTRVTQQAQVLQQREKDLGRLGRLQVEGAVSVSELDQAKLTEQAARSDLALATADRDKASADVDVLRSQLAQTQIRAPFAGRIATGDPQRGAVISSGDALFTLVSGGKMILVFSLSESEAGQLKIGDDVEAKVQGKVLAAKIERIGAAIDTETKGLLVQANLNEVSEELLPGMFADVIVQTKAPPGAAVIPLSALTGSGASREVFLLNKEKSTVAKKSVRLVVDDGERAAVVGIKPGDSIISRGAFGLKDGSTVEVAK